MRPYDVISVYIQIGLHLRPLNSGPSHPPRWNLSSDYSKLSGTLVCLAFRRRGVHLRSAFRSSPAPEPADSFVTFS